MGCAPDKMPEEGNQQTIPPVVDTTPIDKALFSAADDNHTRMGRDYFVNMPGMVLFYDQDFYFSGGGICYVNKTSKVASIYCFDALCEYLFGVCSARFAQRTADIVYPYAATDSYYKHAAALAPQNVIKGGAGYEIPIVAFKEGKNALDYFNQIKAKKIL